MNDYKTEARETADRLRPDIKSADFPALTLAGVAEHNAGIIAALCRRVAAEARAQALEEAARFMETHRYYYSSVAPHHRAELLHESEEPDRAQQVYAAAIRALAEKEPT